VKGITALEQVGRFTIRVFVQVREEAHSHDAHILESEIAVSSTYSVSGRMLFLCRIHLDFTLRGKRENKYFERAITMTVGARQNVFGTEWIYVLHKVVNIVVRNSSL
jgi:hypothetical protein